MANAWKWWLIVLCVIDWYDIFMSVEVVNARSKKEAVTLALKRDWVSGSAFAKAIYGPFDEEPKESK